MISVHSALNDASERACDNRALVHSGSVLELFLIEDLAGFGPAKS
jgi:hypothetical protein